MSVHAAVAFAIVLLAAAALAWAHGSTTHRLPCTHGTSSVGPIRINTGKPVRATPHTEACQP